MRACEECKHEVSLTVPHNNRLFLCGARACPLFICINCWAAHKAWHLLIGHVEDRWLEAYAEAREQEILSLLGKQASAS